MANAIAVQVSYKDLIDRVYKHSSKLSIFDVNEGMRLKFIGDRSFKVAQLSTSGLKKYDRATGKLLPGSTSLAWIEKTFTRLRGTTLPLELTDVDEAGISSLVMEVLTEFMTVQAIPEKEAYRIAKYAASAGIVDADATALTTATIKGKIDSLLTQQTNANVSKMNKYLIMTPDARQLLEDADGITRNFNVQGGTSTINTTVDSYKNMPIIEMPDYLMKDAYVFKDGETAGQENGGFEPAAGAGQIDFMIVQKDAVANIVKYDDVKIYEPGSVPGDKNHYVDYFGYDEVFVWDNKEKGVAVRKTTV